MENGLKGWTGKWLCRKCYYDTDYRHRHNSTNNIIKAMAGRRTGYLNNNSTDALGDICEAITCKVRGVKNLNIENDNYRSPIDHSFDYELGVVQTKGAIFDIERNRWMFYVGNEKNKEFEHLIAYCIDVFMKNILRVYIFPKKEVVKRTGISVSIGIYRGRWVDKYRINEKSYNDAFHDIIKYNNAPYKYKII